MGARVGSVAALLLVSGMCALIYQVAWLREFRLIFGGSTAASAAVLAVFMGGLGLGNLLLGRFADRHSAPLRLYGSLELGIALACAASPLLIDLVRAAYGGLGGQEGLGATGATIVRLLMTVLVLGLPTLLMGGTLPAAAKAAVSADDEQRRYLGLVYGLNTLGAVAGALLSTFYLLPAVGTRTTLWLACAVNVVLALIAWRLARSPNLISAVAQRRRDKKRQKRDAAGATEPSTGEAALLHTTPAAWVYAAALIVGCAFFLMELIWYRMLAPLLGGTTYTFGLILAVALAGIGIGGALYPLLFRRTRPQAAHFALTCAVQAALMALPFALGDHLALFAADLLENKPSSFGGLVGAWATIATIVVFPAALVSGIQFPVLIALLGRGDEHVARQVGNAFAWNTVGCIAGSLLGGFGLLPLMTAPGAWCLVVIVMGLLALAWLVPAYRERRRLAPLVLPVLFSAAALFMLRSTGPTAVWRHSAIGAGRSNFSQFQGNARQYRINQLRRTILWEADGVESSIAIRCSGSFAFYVNGKSDGESVGDASTQIMLGMVAATVHPQPRKTFLVGLGTGESAGWLAAIPEMEQVDVVELEPQVKVMAELCRVANHDALHNPKVRLIINDARETLTTTRETYDLIVSEPSNPYRAGVANLFTREFYASARRRLRPGGIFAQWLQAYEVDKQTVGTVMNTLRQEFPHVEIWRVKQGDLLLLAAEEPIRYDVPQLRARLTQEPYRSAMQITWRANDLESFLAGYIGGLPLVDALAEAAAGRVNTDDHNQLEYSFARSVGSVADFSVSQWRRDAAKLGAARPPVTGGEVDWERVLDATMLTYVIDGSPQVPELPGLNGNQQNRRAAMNTYLAKRWREVATIWEQQAKPPEAATELAIVIVSKLANRDPEVVELIEQLRASQPVEADGFAAMWAHYQGDTSAAVQFLRRALLGLREEPWPRFCGHLCRLAVEIAEAHPQHAPQLYEALREPFALGYRQEEREQAALRVAKLVDQPTLVAHLETYEPHIPWSESFLQMRATAYREAGHPLADRAERELARFLRHKLPEVTAAAR